MKHIASLSLLAVLSLAPAVASATTFTDNFASDPYQLNTTVAGNFQTINGTNVDVLNGPPFGYLCTGVTTCVDMGGTYGNYQGVLQSTTLFSAGTYDLSFVMTGSGRGPVASTLVTFGNYNQLFTLTSADTTSGVVTNQLVNLTTSGYLTFTYESGAFNIGNVIDSVDVTPLAGLRQPVVFGATPEPSSLVLLGSGLVGAAGIIGRRRRTAK